MRSPNLRPSLRLVGSAAALLALTGAAAAAPGQLLPEESGLPPLELREHRVRVTIYDGFAVTRVDQTYVNHLDRDLEATWSFPVPREASVAGCSVWIDGREVVGEVVARERAREVYVAQRRAGRDAALTEREGRGRFAVRVQPVRAGALQRVRLEYYQPLRLDHSVGRYVYPLAAGHADRVRGVFTGEASATSARIEVALHTALPLADVATPGWAGARITELEGPRGGRQVVLETAGAPLAEDFVLYWRVDPEAAARVDLLAHAGGDEEGAFLLTLTPGAELPPIAGGVDWTFVLDVSGSMSGQKLRATVEAVCDLLQELGPEDRFSVVAFSDRARWVAPGPAPAARPDVVAALEAVRSLDAGGSTNVFDGLALAVSTLDAQRTTALVLLTDGVANAGPRQREDFLALLARADVRVFALEVGNEADQALLDRLALASGGTHMDVSTSDLVAGRMLQLRDKVRRTALTDLSVRVEGEEVEVFGLTPARPGNLYAGEQLQVFGRYRGRGPARVSLTARRGGEPVAWTAEVDLPAEGGAPEVLRMWALSRIAELDERLAERGADPALRDEARELALRYGLVTDQTSMLVLPDADRARYGVGDANAQRVAQERAARRAAPRGQQAAATPAPAPPVDGPGSYHRSSGGGWGGGGGGGGAFGPLGALVSALMAGGAARRRRRTVGRGEAAA